MINPWSQTLDFFVTVMSSLPVPETWVVAVAERLVDKHRPNTLQAVPGSVLFMMDYDLARDEYERATELVEIMLASHRGTYPDELFEHSGILISVALYARLFHEHDEPVPESLVGAFQQVIDSLGVELPESSAEWSALELAEYADDIRVEILGPKIEDHPSTG